MIFIVDAVVGEGAFQLDEGAAEFRLFHRNIQLDLAGVVLREGNREGFLHPVHRQGQVVQLAVCLLEGEFEAAQVAVHKVVGIGALENQPFILRPVHLDDLAAGGRDGTEITGKAVPLR